MENFIRIKFAKRDNNSKNTFIIRYKKQIRSKDGDKNKNKYFAELLIKSASRSDNQKIINDFINN